MLRNSIGIIIIIFILSVALQSQDMIEITFPTEYAPSDSFIWYSRISNIEWADTSTIIYATIEPAGDGFNTPFYWFEPRLNIGYSIIASSTYFRNFKWEYHYYDQWWNEIHDVWVISTIDTIWRNEHVKK